MKYKIFCLLTTILLSATILTTVSANTEDELEIVDEEGDTLFDYVDAIWASFYEKPDEPEYLFITLKIANLQDKIGCVYAIHWKHDDIHYDASFRNGVLFPQREFKSWHCHYYQLRRDIDTWDEQLNQGTFELESQITWKLHKSTIGNPQPGDIIYYSYIFTAQRLSSFGLIPFKNLFRSFTDATDPLDSKDYIIQY